jgi:catechol 2,3-dioxygenase-like lactoylglutathione lyase family enzyme
MWGLVFGKEIDMGLVKRVDHLAVVTRDLEASAAFYEDVLGMELVEKGALENVRIRNARLRAPGDPFIVELVEFMDEVEYNYADGFIEVVALKVDDIFAAVAELKGKGVEFLQDEPIPVGPGDYFIFFRGPGGEKLELIQNTQG